ncbi:MAG: helix-turn-helix domain-containing protein [Candidatus Nanohaloarchaea archaeon]|nr:helix-turn-helix domain-containing protein [Candidatus Nanohaloarchaea archaeon]
MQCPPELQELLKTLYNLSPQESELLTVLCEQEATVAQLADDLDRDRSTVQRYLDSLRTAGLIDRKSTPGKGGKGRTYIYMVRDRDDLKAQIRARLDEWVEERVQTLQVI